MNKILILGLLLFTASPGFAIVQDNLANTYLSADTVKKPAINVNYDYSSTDIVPIRLQIIDPIKSEKHLYEGQIIKFQVTQDAGYKGNTIAKKGSIMTSRVETIITNGMNGIPASVVLGNFEINGLKSTCLSASYEKYGIDLSLLVFPLKWALTILPPTGSLTNFIKGGHVRISSRTPITVYYHPNWH